MKRLDIHAIYNVVLIVMGITLMTIAYYKEQAPKVKTDAKYSVVKLSGKLYPNK